MNEIVEFSIDVLGILLAFAIATRIAVIILEAVVGTKLPKVAEAVRCKRILREQFGIETVAEYSHAVNATILICQGNDSVQSVIEPNIDQIRAALERSDAMPNKHVEYGCETLELPWGGGTRKRPKKSLEGQGIARSSAMPQPVYVFV